MPSSPGHMNIDSDEFININMIWWVKYLMLFHSCTLSPIMAPRPSYKFNFEKVHVFKNACRDSSSLPLIKMLGSNFAMIEEIYQKVKVFFQTIMYNEKLYENYLSTRVCLSENLQTKTLMLSDPDSHFEEL